MEQNIIKTYLGLPIIKTYMVQWLRLCLTIQVTKTPGATEQPSQRATTRDPHTLQLLSP